MDGGNLQSNFRTEPVGWSVFGKHPAGGFRIAGWRDLQTRQKQE